MVNFRDSLSKPLESIERPPLAPAGTYRMKVSKQPAFGEMNSANGSWDTITFPMQAVEAIEVADPDALATYGPVNLINLSVRYMFPKGASPEDQTNYKRTEARLRTFLEKHLGLSVELSLGEAINSSLGQQCLGTIGYRADRDDPEVMYAEIKSTAPIE